jgi:hypothetical protein
MVRSEIVMADPVTIRRIEFFRALPWLRLGRALGCALSIPALIIALIGCLLADWSQRAVAKVLPSFTLPSLTTDLGWTSRVPPVQDALVPLWSFHGNAWPLLVLGVVGAVIWSFIGVAVCRCVAVEFCRDESGSFRESVNLAVRTWRTPLGALATPLAGVVMLIVVIAILALPGFVPGLGGIWLRVLAPVMAILGTFAAVILLVLPVLWPLMIAAIAVDDSDGFDAFSRSFSFVTSHPWMTAGLVALSWGMLWACGEVIDRGVVAALNIIPWSAGWSASETAIKESLLPASIWWVRLFARTLHASLFWSLATVAYVFLRQATDDAPLDQLTGYDEPVRAREDFPVVGIPAMNPPVPPAESTVSAE